MLIIEHGADHSPRCHVQQAAPMRTRTVLGPFSILCEPQTGDGIIRFGDDMDDETWHRIRDQKSGAQRSAVTCLGET